MDRVLALRTTDSTEHGGTALTMEAQLDRVLLTMEARHGTDHGGTIDHGGTARTMEAQLLDRVLVLHTTGGIDHGGTTG